MHSLVTSVLLLVSLTSINSNSYDGYKVYKVTAKTDAQNDYLKHIETNPNFDFWSKINKVGNGVQIMVAPNAQKQFCEDLETNNIAHGVEIENVQTTILTEQEYHKTKTGLSNLKITFDQYYTHDQINAYLDQLSEKYPDTVTVSTIGSSYENRTMKIIRISTNKGGIPKPVIFIEAGMHAREWISPALSLYIINQLVENPANSQLLDALDWIVLPSVNPDGYDYTWTTDRMWRKTLSLGAKCSGVDGNRNFGFHWKENGASDDECSEIYAGKTAFSEVEIRNLRNTLAATKNISAFISLHSYGQYLFYPYSYADGIVPDNWKELRDLALKVKDVIFAINGTEYTVGSSTEVLYPAAGCSDDWAMGAVGIDLVYVFELPGGGEKGFDLPPERILPVVSETWEGIKVIADYVTPNHK